MAEGGGRLAAGYALVVWDDAQGRFVLRMLAPAGAPGPARRLAAFRVEPSWEGQRVLWVDTVRVPFGSGPVEWVFDATGGAGLERSAGGPWAWLGRVELDPGPARRRLVTFLLDGAGRLGVQVDDTPGAGPPRLVAGPGTVAFLRRSANGPCAYWVGRFQSERTEHPEPPESPDSAERLAGPASGGGCAAWEPAAAGDAAAARAWAALLARPLPDALAWLGTAEPGGALAAAVEAARAVRPGAGQYVAWDADGARCCAWEGGLPAWVAFGPDGFLAAVDRDGRAAVFRPDRPDPVAAVRLGEPLERVLWSPDGRRLALGGRAGRLWVWPWSEGAAPALADGRPAAWTARQSRLPVTALVPVGPDRFAHDGGDGSVRLRRWPDGAERAVLPGHERGVTALAAPPGGEWLAAGGGDGLVRIWRLADGRLVGTLASHVRAGHGLAAAVAALAVSGDGHWLASASEDGWTRLWSMPGGRLEATLGQGGERPAALRFDGPQVVGLGAAGTYERWDVAGGRLRGRVPAPGRAAGSGALDSAGALALLVEPGGRALLWRGDDACILGRLDPGGGRAVAGALSADGRFAAVLAREPAGLWIWPLFGAGDGWNRWGPRRLARPAVGDPGVARVVRALLEARFAGTPRIRPSRADPGDRVRPVD